MKFSEYLGRFFLTTGVSVVVPLISGYVAGGKVATIDQVFLGLFVFAIGTLLQLSYQVSLFNMRREATLQLWDVRSETDGVLSNIRKSFSDIVSRRNALYCAYFKHKINQLEQVISDAATNEELLVEQDADTTASMLSEFAGADNHIIRFVHYFSDNDFLFDVHASQFFCDVAGQVAAERVREVRRLFIVSDDGELTNARSRKLLEFHRSTPGFSYRLMPARHFERLKVDARLPIETHDFGIYGPWYVYRSKVTAPNEVKGLFSSADSAVQRFITFFENCWNSQFVFSSDVSDTRVTLQDLFGRSAVSPNRPTASLGATIVHEELTPATRVAVLPPSPGEKRGRPSADLVRRTDADADLEGQPRPSDHSQGET